MLGAAQLFYEDLGNKATRCIILMAILYTNSRHGVLRRKWRGPRVRCLQRGDESEEVSDGGRGETPACCVFRSGVCETASEKSGSGGSTLLDGGYCCSSTTALGPAWRWPARCRAVCFLALPLSAWIASCDDFKSRRRWFAAPTQLCSAVQPSGVVLIVLTAQSNRSGPLQVVFEFSPC